MIISENPRLALTSLSAAASVMPYSLRIGEGRYRMDEAGRSDVAEQLGLVDARSIIPTDGALPEGVEWPCVDGEPVVPGDVLWDSDGTRRRVADVRFWREGCYVVMDDKSEWGEVIIDRDFTRTEPPKPVLDRDGVPIEVGDTVYRASNGKTLEVMALNSQSGHSIFGKVLGDTKCVYYNAMELTHERPDSWERIKADVEKNCCLYFGREGRACECEDCPVPDGEWDCDTYKVRDLIRRAKALAGVVGDE